MVTWTSLYSDVTLSFIRLRGKCAKYSIFWYPTRCTKISDWKMIVRKKMEISSKCSSTKRKRKKFKLGHIRKEKKKNAFAQLYPLSLCLKVGRKPALSVGWRKCRNHLQQAPSISMGCFSRRRFRLFFLLLSRERDRVRGTSIHIEYREIYTEREIAWEINLHETITGDCGGDGLLKRNKVTPAPTFLLMGRITH